MNDFVVTINGKKRHIKIIDDATLLVDGKNTNFELSNLSNGTCILKIDNKVYEVSQQKIDGERISLLINGKTFESIGRTSLQEKASNILEKADALLKHISVVKAPMPGLILKVKKKSGELVEKGDSVIILEAMKMENEIKAPVSGTISEINTGEGSAVEKNSFLFSIV